MENQKDNKENEIFYETVTGSEICRMLKKILAGSPAQSYLFCSKDADALLLLVRFLIKSENDNKENSADIIHFADDKVLTADIEKITSTAFLTPLELKYRYYIIKNGNTMNDSAANKLLKTLEEPPAKIKIIILADDENSVLPTVRSRCRIITLPPISQAAISLAADKAYGERSEVDLTRIKNLALGSITRMKKAAAGGYDDTENRVFDCLTGLKRSTDVARYSHLLSKLKDEFSEAIDFFELVFGDILRIYGGHMPILMHRQEELKEIACFYRAETIIRLGSVLAKARTRFRFSGNAASIVDEFLFSLLEIRAKCQTN